MPDVALDVALVDRRWPAIDWLMKLNVKLNSDPENYPQFLSAAAEDGQLSFIKFFEEKYYPLNQTEVVNYFLGKNPPADVTEQMIKWITNP